MNYNEKMIESYKNQITILNEKIVSIESNFLKKKKDYENSLTEIKILKKFNYDLISSIQLKDEKLTFYKKLILKMKNVKGNMNLNPKRKNYLKFNKSITNNKYINNRTNNNITNFKKRNNKFISNDFQSNKKIEIISCISKTNFENIIKSQCNSLAHIFENKMPEDNKLNFKINKLKQVIFSRIKHNGKIDFKNKKSFQKIFNNKKKDNSNEKNLKIDESEKDKFIDLKEIKKNEIEEEDIKENKKNIKKEIKFYTDFNNKENSKSNNGISKSINSENWIKKNNNSKFNNLFEELFICSIKKDELIKAHYNYIVDENNNINLMPQIIYCYPNYYDK